MNELFRRRHLTCASLTGLHRVAYLEWGDPANDRVVVCVHSLTRCARDFDALARALLPEYRVVCVDLPGRGESDWLESPAEYIVPTYVNDVVTLIARLDVEQVDWVGTSLGGIVGMVLGARPGNPIRKLVVNDASPVIPAVALERFGTYLGTTPEFDSIQEAERYIRTLSAPFGAHSDAEWRFLTEHVVRPGDNGGFRMRYDPAIAVPYDAQRPFKDVDLWAFWDAITCRALVLRGAGSDVLGHDIAAQMTRRGPRAKLVEFPGIGHAPTLLHADQIAPVREFLLAPDQ